MSAARSAWVIGRAGRNAGGASHPASAAAGTKTPSVTQACRWTWWLSAEPKRCRKEMPPSRGRAACRRVGSQRCAPAAAKSSPLDLVKKDLREGGDGSGSVGQHAPQSLRHGDHPLPHGHRRDDVIDEVESRWLHPRGTARRGMISTGANGIASRSGGARSALAVSRSTCRKLPDASVRIALIDRDVPSYFHSLEHLLRYRPGPPSHSNDSP